MEVEEAGKFGDTSGVLRGIELEEARIWGVVQKPSAAFCHPSIPGEVRKGCSVAGRGDRERRLRALTLFYRQGLGAQLRVCPYSYS